jgi:hypothetical protein
VNDLEALASALRRVADFYGTHKPGIRQLTVTRSQWRKLEHEERAELAALGIERREDGSLYFGDYAIRIAPPLTAKAPVTGPLTASGREA